MSTQVVVPTALLENVIRFVDISSLTAKRAIDEVDAWRTDSHQAAQMCQPLVEHMLSTGVLAATQKQAAEKMLASHSSTVTLLKMAIDKIAELSLTKRGSALEPGEAMTSGRSEFGSNGSGDYNSLADPFIGRHTDRVKESDKPLRALAGLS